MPITLPCLPGTILVPCSSLASAAYRMSLTSVDLPDPETPVTAMKVPSGNATSTRRKLCSVAPLTTTSLLLETLRRLAGNGIDSRPVRYAPVSDSSLASSSSSGPETTIWPPCSPARGPMSTTQSAALIVSSSCSTTISVLPRSRRRSSLASSPIGSSQYAAIDRPSTVTASVSGLSLVPLQDGHGSFCLYAAN